MITAEVNGTLSRWIYDVGAMIEQGEAIAEIETPEGPALVYAPARGRFTEMIALAGDAVEAGKVIGWIDAVETEETPQPLYSLLDEPDERKLKARRKTQSAGRPLPLRWLMVGLLSTVGLGGLLIWVALAPVQSEVTAETAVPATIALPDGPQPTPFFLLGEWVYLREPVGDVQAGTQGIVQSSTYEPGSGTLYDVRFGDMVLQVSEYQIGSMEDLAPTPTMRFNAYIGNRSGWLMLKEPVADFPAGTWVQVGSAMFNGVEWELQVMTENCNSLTVREALLAEPSEATPAPQSAC